MKEDPNLPPGWPANVPLPTIEEVETALRNGQRMVKTWEKERRAKNKPCVCVGLGLRHGPWCPDWEAPL